MKDYGGEGFFGEVLFEFNDNVLFSTSNFTTYYIVKILKLNMLFWSCSLKIFYKTTFQTYILNTN